MLEKKLVGKGRAERSVEILLKSEMMKMKIEKNKRDVIISAMTLLELCLEHGWRDIKNLSPL